MASRCDLRPLPSYGAVAKRRVNGRHLSQAHLELQGIPLLLALLTPWALGLGEKTMRWTIFVASYALAAFSLHHAAPVSTRSRGDACVACRRCLELALLAMLGAWPFQTMSIWLRRAKMMVPSR